MELLQAIKFCKVKNNKEDNCQNNKYNNNDGNCEILFWSMEGLMNEMRSSPTFFKSSKFWKYFKGLRSFNSAYIQNYF